MITLNKGRYVNFLGVHDTTVPFRDQGLVLVTGENGNGKSTLFVEGPYYGFYGSSIRYGDNPGDGVIRSGQKAFAVIHEVEVDGETYIIGRCKKFKKLNLEGDFSEIDFPDGLSVWHKGQNHARGHNSDTQKWLNSLYGMGPRTFLASAMFTSDMLKFPLLGDAKKKEILDELLQLGSLEKALEITRTKRKSIETELTQLKARKEVVEGQIQPLKDEIGDLSEKERGWAKDRAFRLNAARKQSEEAKSNLQTAKDTQTELRGALQAKQTDYAARQKKLEKARQTLQTAREEFLQNKVVVDARVSTQRQAVESLEQELKVKKALMGTACVKCGQNVPKNDDWLTEKEAQIAKEKKSLEVLLKEQEETQSRSTELAEARTILEEREATLSELAKKITKASRILDQASDDVANATQDATKSDANVATIEGETNPYKAQVASAQTRLSQVEARLKEFGDGTQDKETLLEDEKLLEQCFSNKGCRTFLLDKVTPALNLAAANVRALMDTPLLVTFAVRGEDQSYAGSFEIKVQNPAGASDYKGDSSGERRRVDMIIMFSLLSLASHRGAKSFSQAFFDEAWETLDEKGEMGVLNLIKHEAQKRSSLFALSHTASRVKSSVEKIWTVYPGGRLDFGNS